MPDITEYGEIVFTTLDEWGRRRIDGLLEDGTKIIVTALPPITTISITDSGIGVDTINTLSEVSIQDSGIGTEIITIKTEIPIQDSGTGTEIINILSQALIQDSGIGTDLISPIQTFLFITDTGVGTDLIETKQFKEVLDSGVGIDAVEIKSYVSISDLGAGIDTILVRGNIFVSDSGMGIDSLTVFLLKSLLDSGVSIDQIQVISTEFISDLGIGTETIFRKIVFIPRLIDDEDFSKPVIVQKHKTETLTLWEKQSVSAGAETDEIDVSKLASFSCYFGVSSATNIKILYETTLGWALYEEILFGDFVFNSETELYEFTVPFWMIPFKRIKFKVTQATISTIQLFLRT